MRKKIEFTKAFLPPFQEYIEKIKNIWGNNIVTNQGPLHEEFKECLKKYLNLKGVTLCVNGHMALEVVLNSMNLKGEVITTPFTFSSTIHALVRSGLKPVFCDVGVDQYTIDADKIEELITKQTTAILGVHIFGFPCQVEKIEVIAKKYNLKVIYDAAHAFGVKISNVSIGNFGDASMFSLHATKIFNSIEGGILTYSDLNLEEKFNLTKNFGLIASDIVKSIGFNAKMNEFQAAMGILNLTYLELEIQKRKKITELYDKLLKDVKGIFLLKRNNSITYNYIYYPILVEETYYLTRDKLYSLLQKKGIKTRKCYSPLITDSECYMNKFSNTNIENARKLEKKVILLPIYGELSFEDLEYITEIIRKG